MLQRRCWLVWSPNEQLSCLELLLRRFCNPHSRHPRSYLVLITQAKDSLCDLQRRR